MRVLFAPDKFAGTMSALEAANAMASGWTDARPGDEVRVLPMADGGPGSVDVVADTAGSVRHSTPTVDQLGRPVDASWLELPDSTALVESSEACGIHLVEPGERDPLNQTTWGVGVLLRHVIQLGFSRVLIGMGGTGTVDGGLGAVTALGAQTFDGSGRPIEVPTPSRYTRIGAVGPLVDFECDVVALVDVNNPLLGSAGAAHVFGLQKGASESDILALETNLEHLADVVEGVLPGGPWRDEPGAGAAGGLAFGLMAWAGATVVQGAAAIASMVGLDSHIEWADLIVTGEGKIDHQTRAGKVPAYVASRARELGKPVFAIAGQANRESLAEFDQVEVLGPDGLVEPVAKTGEAAARLASSSALSATDG